MFQLQTTTLHRIYRNTAAEYTLLVKVHLLQLTGSNSNGLPTNTINDPGIAKKRF